MIDIKAAIESCSKLNFTPDLHKLRYFGGGLPVFLWDSCQGYNFCKEVLFDLPYHNHVESRHPMAVTVGKYLPWYNLDPSPHSFEDYCLEESEDLELISTSEYNVGEPRPIEGKICYMTLEALKAFDEHYENQHLFDRIQIDVYPNVVNKNPIRCFTWMNNVDQVSIFESKSSEYVFSPSIDVVPFKETEKGHYKHG